MSDTHGPIWIVNAPTTPYPDDRFDAPADTWAKIAAEPYGPTGAPLDPQQPTPEDMAYEIAVLRMRVDGWKSRYGAEHAIAESARLTVKEIETVLRGWPFPTVSTLPHLRALYALLAPPAPVWQAKEE